MAYNLLTVGNPNSGKTTLFNGLSGAHQQVGNWAGVTVEKKVGYYQFNEQTVHLTDLPGIYALDSGNDTNSLDEAIASHAVLTHDTDLIINVVDATCLERSLYMTLQLRELGRPMVVILNKTDALRRSRQRIDDQRLAQYLGCPVLSLSANSLRQVRQLKLLLSRYLQQGLTLSPLRITYADQFEQAIAQVESSLSSDTRVATRALAIRALEQERLVTDALSTEQQALVARVIEQCPLDIDLHIADTKYGVLHQFCQRIRRCEGVLSHSMTQHIDRIILNQWVGIPFFFLVMYAMFMFSINIGSAFIDFFDISVGAVLVEGGHYLLDTHLPAWLVTLIADGVGGGIQIVATFIPVIACLYLFLAVLESSGYMSRAAFVLDKVMQKIGLPGKAFVPLVLGFGCNVPAIMATRTLDQERERKLSATMVPFMSCGARLPVYALFAAAFFPDNGQHIVFALYLLGIGVAIFTGLFFKHTLYPGSSDSLMMEIPDYELPTLRNVMMKTWQKLQRFVLGAGKTIVLVVTVLSFLNSVSVDGTFGYQDTADSVLAKIAQVATPIFKPMGIESQNWQATVGIITGIFAKEAVVGTLNNLYTAQAPAPSDYDLWSRLQAASLSIPENLAAIALSDPMGLDVGNMRNSQEAAQEQGVDSHIFTNLKLNFNSGYAAFAYLIMILLYTPCVAAMGAYVREFGGQFAMLIGGWTLALGYGGATLFYQWSQWSQQPIQAAGWTLGIAVSLWIVFVSLRRTRMRLSPKVVAEI